MERKFTKGEWFAVDYAGRFVIQNGPNYSDTDILQYEDFDGAETCVSEDEAFANAILIEAAPDLFRALDDCVHLLRLIGYGDGPICTRGAKALKKATE